MNSNKLFYDTTKKFTIIVFCLSIPILGLAATNQIEVNLQVGDPVVDPGSSGGGPLLDPIKSPKTLSLISRELTASESRIVISWEASKAALAELQWGVDARLADGVISSVEIERQGVISIEGLQPNTSYQLRLILRSPAGEVVVKDFTLKTLSTVLQTPNVQLIGTAIISDSNIIPWYDLDISDWDYIKIKYSPDHFPSDSFSDELIYEGRTNQVRNISPGFYSIFVRDKEGNYSSGVGVLVLDDGLQNAEIAMFQGQLGTGSKSLVAGSGEVIVYPVLGNNCDGEVIRVSCRVLFDFGNMSDQPDLIVIDGDNNQTRILLIPTDKNSVIVEPFINPGSYKWSLYRFDEVSKSYELLPESGMLTIEADKETDDFRPINLGWLLINYWPWWLILIFLIALFHQKVSYR